MNDKLLSILLFCSFVTGPVALSLQSVQAQAQTSSDLTTEGARMDTLASSQGGEKVIGKISSDFSSFLGTGSRDVVVGLRNGTPISFAPIAPGDAPVIITPPTGKMGFGNVFISLALAKQQLGQLGIAQPTPAQLQAALLGGPITTGAGVTATTTNLQGILTLRSQNMGWGQIAQKLGYKVGPVVSAMKSANQKIATGGAASTGKGIVNAGSQAAGSSESGITSAGGKAIGKSGKALSGKTEASGGIVTGSGRAVGQGGITTARGHAYGATGENQGATSGSQGGGQAKGHNK